MFYSSLPAGDSADVRPVVKVKPDHLLKSTDTKVSFIKDVKAFDLGGERSH